MAAGVTIKHKRKAGAFSGGDLAAGEIGIDTTNAEAYFSTEGSTVNRIAGDMEQIAEADISADATVDFTAAKLFDGTFRSLMFAGENIVPASDGALFWLRVRIGGSWQSGASDYNWNGRTGVTAVSSASDSAIRLANGVGNGTGENLRFNLFCGRLNSSTYKLFSSICSRHSTAGTVQDQSISGCYQSATTALDGLRFMFSTDNLSSGIITAWGLK